MTVFKLVPRGKDYHVSIDYTCPYCGRIAALVGPIGSQASWYCPCGNGLAVTIPNVYLEQKQEDA